MLYLNNLRKQLEFVINNSGLSIDAAYYVIKDVLNELTEIMINEIDKENAEVGQAGVEAAPAAISKEEQEENKTE